MRRPDPKTFELPTYAVLVSSSGEILDARAHHRPDDKAFVNLQGRSYADQCAPMYRKAIKELLSRQRQLLSAVMPPPTLGIDAWFAVVGVPLGPAKDSGALFVHMDISPWVTVTEDSQVPKSISMDLLQQAMASTFIGSEAEATKSPRSKIHYDGIESLTARQREVLKLIGMGKSNVEIAQDLSCSLNTVKRHVTAVLQKLKLPNRTRAAMLISKLNSGLED